MNPANPISSVQPIPELKSLLPFRETPWNMSTAVFTRVRSQSTHLPYRTCEILDSDPEFKFILKYFEHQKPIGLGIKRITCIHNPDHTQVFEGTFLNMEQEAANPFFEPKGKEEEPKQERALALKRWEQQTQQFSPVDIQRANGRPETCLKAKVLPLWHGSTAVVCQSIFKSGFTSFGKHHFFDEAATKGNVKNTDKGFFGSGIYFTNSARYAAMYSSEGQLLLTWVSMREPYPVVSDVPHPQKSSDMKKLEGKEHYQNYNSHYIPVASIKPDDPSCMIYYPCYKKQVPTWDEFVVFYPAQALTRFCIELGVDFPNVPISSAPKVGDFLTFVISLMDKDEIKHHPALFNLLQSKCDELLALAEESALQPENDKFYKLTKRLLIEGEKLSPAVVNMLLKAGSTSSPAVSSNPALKPQPPHSSPTAVKTPVVANLKSVPQYSTPSGKSSPLVLKPAAPKISVSLADIEYEKGLNFAKKGELNEAFACYLKAAEKGHSYAQYLVARCLRHGEGTTKDKQKAEIWCRKAADQGHLVAQGNCFAYGYGVPRNPVESVKWYQKAVDQQDPYGFYSLGNCYAYGEGVPADTPKAFELYQKGALQNHVQSQYQLGLCFYHGHGTEKNLEKAAEMFERAAQQGYGLAQWMFGQCYNMGLGKPRDFAESFIWFLKAAKQGVGEAQSEVGLCYEMGKGVTRDLKEAYKWYHQAAEQGITNVQYNLGIAYYNGQNVSKDFKQAFKFFKGAAEAGHPGAQCNVGICYQTGNGIEKNEKEAFKYFSKSAEQGYSKAQFKLAECYDGGRGVDKDETKALKWYTIAAENGDSEAQLNLGLIFKLGLYGTQDLNQAFKWLKKAALQGDAQAEYEIGQFYFNGWATEIDYVEAVKWYLKAASHNETSAYIPLGDCYFEGAGVLQNPKEAFKWYSKAVEADHSPLSLCKLAHCYLNGQGVPQDENQAFKLYQKAAENNFAYAKYYLGLCYFQGKGTKKNINLASKHFQLAAEQNNADAQYMFALCILEGEPGEDLHPIGIAMKYDAAKKWFQKAADQGHPEALKHIEKANSTLKEPSSHNMHNLIP